MAVKGKSFRSEKNNVTATCDQASTKKIKHKLTKKYSGITQCSNYRLTKPMMYTVTPNIKTTFMHFAAPRVHELQLDYSPDGNQVFIMMFSFPHQVLFSSSFMNPHNYKKDATLKFEIA